MGSEEWALRLSEQRVQKHRSHDMLGNSRIAKDEWQELGEEKR